MTNSEEAKKQINIIGPALRALLACDSTLKVIGFEQTSEASDALIFQPTPGQTAAQIVQHLKSAIANHKLKTGGAPQAVLVPGIGLFREVADKKPLVGRVAGRIAIVTGAAQGFGLEISQHFVAEGGRVVLADMNADGAKKAAADLCARYGECRAIGLSVNVTSGACVEQLIHDVVCGFGGLDVLISNAGVLKAGSVKTQPEKDFDFVTAVNYKGFFLCTQKAAPILGIQRLAKPDYWSDIIQINSKSGLRGSNKNGAYAGGKFGGIGLVESFALELVEDGIKVNAICPGNFYDGPLWSDPVNGLFVQYLNTGKVPGAKTIDDVRKFYEAQAPIRRGCTTPDVMKAVYYLIDQVYETGQALPVTGGQVMLK